jgi:hypothetical protein
MGSHLIYRAEEPWRRVLRRLVDARLEALMRQSSQCRARRRAGRPAAAATATGAHGYRGRTSRTPKRSRPVMKGSAVDSATRPFLSGLPQGVRVGSSGRNRRPHRSIMSRLARFCAGARLPCGIEVSRYPMNRRFEEGLEAPSPGCTTHPGEVTVVGARGLHQVGRVDELLAVCDMREWQ